jgi:signal transduction histidine kinase
MRGDSESAELCNLRAIIVAAYEAAGVGNYSRIGWILDVPAHLEISLVRSRVERVFLNLIANALQAMPESGEIRITAVDQGDCVSIAVEDNGPGIPVKIRGRLFEPFVSSGKESGLGLGLTFCRQTIRDHGGDLWWEPAAGARFIVLLPKQPLTPDEPRFTESAVTNETVCC